MEAWDNIIELKHVTKVFDDDGCVAVSDLCLDVKKGEFITLLGPLGCGKTTTLRMIAGLEVPTSGEILLAEKDITSLPPHKRPVNTVFRGYALFPHMNIYDNIAFGLKLKKLPKAEMDEKVKKVLKTVDLEGFENRKVSSLSAGQQQRIAIARAVVNEPEVLLLDEPLDELDPKTKKEMQSELMAMHERLGITFIYVTHDRDEALTMSDRIVVMSRGQILQIGTPEVVYNEPANVFAADLVGDSNIFRGIMTGRQKVRFAGGEFACTDDVPEGTQVDIVVRPEDVTWDADASKGTVGGTVTGVGFKGTHYRITAEIGKAEMVIRSAKAPGVGDEIGMSIALDRIRVIRAEDQTAGFIADVVDAFTLDYNGHEIKCSLDQVIPGTKIRAEMLVDRSNEPVELSGLKVQVSIGTADIQLSDDETSGLMTGRIISLIRKGDHYSYVVHTDQGNDLVVDDEYLRSMDDRVSLIMPEDKMTFGEKK